MVMAIRSFTEPPGLKDSIFTAIRPGSPCPIRRSPTSGVSPTVSRIVPAMAESGFTGFSFLRRKR